MCSVGTKQASRERKLISKAKAELTESVAKFNAQSGLQITVKEVYRLLGVRNALYSKSEYWVVRTALLTQ